jgi:hypothetical protein
MLTMKVMINSKSKGNKLIIEFVLDRFRLLKDVAPPDSDELETIMMMTMMLILSSANRNSNRTIPDSDSDGDDVSDILFWLFVLLVLCAPDLRFFFLVVLPFARFGVAGLLFG